VPAVGGRARENAHATRRRQRLKIVRNGEKR